MHSHAAIISLFTALTLGGILMQFLVRQRLARECRLLKRIQTEGYAQPAETIAGWAYQASGDPDSLTLQHIRLVQRAVMSRQSTSATELVEATEENEAGHWWHILPNLLLAVTLIAGLAGTMVGVKGVLEGGAVQGLLKAAQTLHSDATPDQITGFAKQVTDSIEAIYRGFGGAFTFSVAGVCSTIALTLTNLMMLRPQQTQFSALLHQTTIEVFLPTFAPRDDRLADQLVSAGESLQALTLQMSNSLQTMTEQICGRLTRTGETLSISASQIAAQAANVARSAVTMTDTLGALGEVQTQLAQTFGEGGPFRNMADHMQHLATMLVSSCDTLQQTVNEVGTRIQEPFEKVQGDMSALAQSAATLIENSQSLIGATTGIQSSLKLTNQARTAREKQLLQHAAILADAAPVLGQLRDDVRQVIEGRERVEAWMGTIQHQALRAANAVEATVELSRSTQASLEGIQQAIGGIEGTSDGTDFQQGRSVLAVLTATHTGILASQSEMIRSIQAAETATNQRLDRLGDLTGRNLAAIDGVRGIAEDLKIAAAKAESFWATTEQDKLDWMSKLTQSLQASNQEALQFELEPPKIPEEGRDSTRTDREDARGVLRALSK